MRHFRSAAMSAVFVVLVCTAGPASALPTMIRLGYADCAACHVSPQGGGPLNAYGRGIDQAQSLRGGEYAPATDELAKALTIGGRMLQDVRTVMQEQETWTTGRPSAALFRPRVMYRNVTTLSPALRVSATITGETQAFSRPAMSYDPPSRSSTWFVNTALVHYRASPTIELAAGRDQLPSGINGPDLALFTKSRNRLGYYDAPIQVKAFWNAKRFHVIPYGYGSSGNEAPGERESGVGTLAEADLLGRQKAIVGVSLLRGLADNGDRRTTGFYTRLGFGAWGILAEHDITDCVRPRTAATPLRQSTSSAQVFWAMREWLVVSAIGERLRVQQPFEERLAAGKLEIAARLSSQASIGVSGRLQRDAVSGRYARSIALQAAIKTVQ